MLDLFTIFSKGGIILWCFQGANQILVPSVNALIKSVFLQERGSVTPFSHNGLTLMFKLDNEFELVFLTVYQSTVQLSYMDKLLNDVQLKFRDRYRNILEDPSSLYPLCGQTNGFLDLGAHFDKIFRGFEASNKITPVQKMQSYEESAKSEKTVASMTQKPAANATVAQPAKKNTIPTKSKPPVGSKVVEVAVASAAG